MAELILDIWWAPNLVTHGHAKAASRTSKKVQPSDVRGRGPTSSSWRRASAAYAQTPPYWFCKQLFITKSVQGNNSIKSFQHDILSNTLGGLHVLLRLAFDPTRTWMTSGHLARTQACNKFRFAFSTFQIRANDGQQAAWTLSYDFLLTFLPQNSSLSTPLCFARIWTQLQRWTQFPVLSLREKLHNWGPGVQPGKIILRYNQPASLLKCLTLPTLPCTIVHH